MKSFPLRKPFWVAAVLAGAAAGWMADRAFEDASGATAPRRPRTLVDFVLRIYDRIAQHRVTSIAAGVTYFVLLALFPAIGALVSIYGLYANPVALSDQLQTMQSFLPSGAIDIIGEQLKRLTEHQNSALSVAFVAGVAVSLWSANAGMKAMFDALNIIHDEAETRNFFVLNVITLAFTLGLIVFFLVAISVIVILPVVLTSVGVGAWEEWLVSIGRWPLLFIAIALILAVVYRFGPCCRDAHWRWITLGSAIASFAFIIVSMLFSWYAAHFGNFDKTYGTLGAVIGFMTWNWIVTIVILIGAEIDAELAGAPAKPVDQAGS
jgi:membrane protein